jgi:hypothetical protein
VDPRDRLLPPHPVVSSIFPTPFAFPLHHIPLSLSTWQDGGASAELPIRYEQFEAASKLQEKRDMLMQV